MGIRSSLTKRESGYSLLELLMAMVILAILAGIAIPTFSVWLPNYRLRRAMTDLYGNLQLAKLSAIKENQNCSVTFSTAPDRYVINLPGKTVVMRDYGSGVCMEDPTGTLPFDVTAATITLNSRGMVAAGSGYVYLTNENKRTFYRVGPGASTAGVIESFRWNDPVWE